MGVGPHGRPVAEGGALSGKGRHEQAAGWPGTGCSESTASGGMQLAAGTVTVTLSQVRAQSRTYACWAKGAGGVPPPPACRRCPVSGQGNDRVYVTLTYEWWGGWGAHLATRIPCQ